MILTQEEANKLISEIKDLLVKRSYAFPTGKGKLSFDVVGQKSLSEFSVSIERKGINNNACTYQGRIKSNNIVLLRLDASPTAVHTNPSGEKIKGPHLHIYSEKYESREAIPFNVENNDLYELCYTFFEKFNIMQPPQITAQTCIE